MLEQVRVAYLLNSNRPLSASPVGKENKNLTMKVHELEKNWPANKFSVLFH